MTIELTEDQKNILAMLAKLVPVTKQAIVRGEDKRALQTIEWGVAYLTELKGTLKG